MTDVYIDQELAVYDGNICDYGWQHSCQFMNIIMANESIVNGSGSFYDRKNEAV